MRHISRVTRAARLCGLTFSVLLLTLTCSAVARAQAGRSATRTWVSATAGSDTNPCTRAEPCRDLASAVNAVAPEGEVFVLDSGIYGGFEVTKSVQVVAPEGVHAVIAPTTGFPVTGDPEQGHLAAVLVNAPGATVVLRNLTVNSFGSVTDALRATAVGMLHIENCVFGVVNDMPNGDFPDTGISFTAGGRLVMRDVTVRNFGVGILIVGTQGGTAYASIDRCRLDGGTTGVHAYYNARVTVSNTVATDGAGAGFSVYTPPDGPATELSCDNCVSTNRYVGFRSSGGPGALVRVARSSATNNHYGFYNDSSGSKLRSLAGTNMVDGNKTNRIGPVTTFSPDAP
jgi:hypothetical protein